ncbi:MAG: hypothetical protein OMM_13470, partial [Candidatus Magnetoglobus multicellularis str. Araruama]
HIMTTGEGTIDIQAKGNISIFDGNTITANANVRMVADETLTIGSIMADGISLTAKKIIDSDTDHININANHLLIKSLDAGAGTQDNMLDISVDRFSASVYDLFIHEADGIQIDDVGEMTVNRVTIHGCLAENTLVDSMSAGIVSTGDVYLHVDSGNTIINQMTSQGNMTIINDSGSIVDHADDQLVDLTAGDEKLITLTVANNIEGKTNDTFLEVADNSTLIAKSTSQGNIHIQGMGSLNLQKLETTDGLIQVKTQNNIFIDYIEAIGNIDLIALSGSILEARDDATVNLKADQSITLTASENIGNPDGKYLDVADLSTVAVSSTAQGDIFIRGEGELIINDASTANGRIDIVANDQIQALNLVSGGDQTLIHNLSGDILIGKILSDDQIVIIADQGAIMDFTNDNLVDLTSGNNKQIILNAFN